ncbi:hypothetical protein LSH36_69g05005 [Paralvinella palmiformis]|uniref:CRAL-TRIO domain-containing protein n=1 Tax=Paralvinella palmiformis TaxID=53620 RepID=A0AAD9K351_9ANNE|nr:hypothetical protein LSH36_69g05005 [Paralvinella palmiformis]
MKKSRPKKRICILIEARAVYQRAPDGSLVKADVPPCVQTISPLPQTIEDVHQEVLMSGAVIYPGCRDVRGAAVVIVFCRHPAWRMEYFTSQELAKILLYYYTVPRKDISDKGLTVIADARGTTPPVLNAFLETLYTVQANQPGTIYISHVLADRVAQSLLFRSPVFRPQVNLRIDLVMSVETLYKFVSPEHLPLELGGYLQNNNVSWVHFRFKLERFLKQCRNVGEQLVHLMQEMSTLECLPATAPDASHQVELHKQCVAEALESDTVVSLKEQGHSVLSSLNTHQHDLAENEDFRSSLHAAEHLYSQVQDTAVKLSNLAKDHLHRLETCNQRHLLEIQMSKSVATECRSARLTSGSGPVYKQWINGNMGTRLGMLVGSGDFIALIEMLELGAA